MTSSASRKRYILRGTKPVSIRVYAIRPDIFPFHDPFHSEISVTLGFQGAPVIVKVCALSSPPGAGRGAYRVLARTGWPLVN